MPNIEPDCDSGLVHVAVAVIVRDGEVLIARRPDHVHQGGLWEFPGGKREASETLAQCFVRELREELALEVDPLGLRPFLKIRHDYGDKKVLLDVWRVTRFAGEPVGAEGQPVRWVSLSQLADYEFPVANMAVVKALALPEKMLITGDYASLDVAIRKVTRALEDFGVGMVQYRPDRDRLNLNQARAHAQVLHELCRSRQTPFILNAGGFFDAPELWGQAGDGVHVPAGLAQSLSKRPVSEDRWCSVACHNARELAHARRIKADFVTLSPVLKTASHPDVPGLEWAGFGALVHEAGMPVFALGGLSPADLSRVLEVGAVGMAAIRGWWL